MSTGRQLNMLEQQLFRLQQRVRQVRLNALGSGQSPGAGAPEDPTRATQFYRLGQTFVPIRQDLDRIIRQLDQIDHWLALRDRLALRIAREQRYSARQSVRDLQARGRTIYQLVDDIRADITRIVEDAGFPTESERIELIHTAMDNVSEFAGHGHEVQALLGQPAIVAPHVTVNVPLPGLLLTVYVLVLYLVRKGGGKTTPEGNRPAG